MEDQILAMMTKRTMKNRDVSRQIDVLKAMMRRCDVREPDDVEMTLRCLINARDSFNLAHDAVASILETQEERDSLEADYLNVIEEISDIDRAAREWICEEDPTRSTPPCNSAYRNPPDSAAKDKTLELLQGLKDLVIHGNKDRDTSYQEQERRHRQEIDMLKSELSSLRTQVNEDRRAHRRIETSTPAAPSQRAVNFSDSRSFPANVTRSRNDTFSERDSSVVHELVAQNTSLIQTMINDSRAFRFDCIDSAEIPHTKLSVFSGDPLDYWPFMKSFNDLVECSNIRDSKKLNILYQHCNPEVQKHISGCQLLPSNQGYAKAKAILQAKFGCPFTISQAWKSKFTRYPLLSNPEMFQAFAEDLSNCYSTLVEMQYTSELQSADSLSILLSKLPIALRSKWRRTHRTALTHGGIGNLEDLVRVVVEAAEDKNDPIFGDERLDKITNTFVAAPVSSESRSRYVPPSGSSRPPQGTRSNRHQVHNISEEVIPDEEEFDAQISIMFGEARPKNCSACQGDHYTSNCESYLALSPPDRLKLARQKRLCILCLSPGHFISACKQQWRCKEKGCGYRHNVTLHGAFTQGRMHPKQEVQCTEVEEKFPTADDESSSLEQDVSDEFITLDTTGDIYNIEHCVVSSLPITPILIQGTKSKCHINVLLDNGSTTSICSRELIPKLGLVQLGQAVLRVNTVVGKQLLKGSIVDFEVSDTNGGETLPAFHVLCIPKLPISSQHVLTPSQIGQWEHLKGLPIPQINAQSVDLLLGQDNAHLLEPLQKVKGPNLLDPYAVRTPLGWTVYGFRDAALSASVAHCSTSLVRQPDACIFTVSLDELVENLWKLDEVQVKPHMSPENRAVMTKWEKSARLVEGKFCFPIPFKKDTLKFPNNKSVAMARLVALGKKLHRNPELHRKYSKPMQVNIDCGFAELVVSAAKLGREWHLLHHAVEHKRKPDVARVVWRGDFELMGISLNNQVYQGPDNTNKLSKVLHNFRIYEVAFTADIEKMFNQVLVPEEERDLLRFLWFRDGDPTKEILTYRMKTHVFGSRWAPSLVCLALRKSIDVFGKEYDQQVVQTILRCFYVDDLLRSILNIIRAINTLLGVKELLGRVGFNLTKIACNKAEVLQAFDEKDRAKSEVTLDFDGERLFITHTLGLQWRSVQDIFKFTYTFETRPRTKRGMLSTMATLFDPLGFCTPFLLVPKRLLQELAKRKMGWDDPLPDDIQRQWEKWAHDAKDLERLEVPRWIGFVEDEQQLQLHHFSDASEAAYGTVSYICVLDKAGRIIKSTILQSRLKLAPIATQSIPRLELCGAHLSAKVEESLQEELDVSLASSHFWTDSTLVLRYISGHPAQFKTFTANRLAEIQQVTKPSQWHFVPGTLNPADILSRGTTAADLADSKVWMHGPDFLLSDRTQWPSQPNFLTTDLPVEETKRERAIYSAEGFPSIGSLIFNEMFESYSSWMRLLRAVAWLIKFTKHIMSKSAKYKAIQLTRRIQVSELRRAEGFIIQITQQTHLSDKHKAQDIFKSLSPIIIDDVYCVGGRLTKSAFSSEFCHPRILPPNSHVVALFIMFCHLETHHGGVDRTLVQVRRSSWLLTGRNAVKSALSNCMYCRRLKVKPLEQRMADLPSFRLQSGGSAFEYTGVDYFGPISVKVNRSSVKRHICCFTCAVTRAVHLELAADLSASAFLNVLFRFIARRGKPAKIISDNGTNFIGAKSELDRLEAEFNHDKVADFCTSNGIEWVFNPPSASHHGGMWERQIRTVQGPLTSIANNQTLTDDSLYTYACIAEQTVNSRPLTKQSDCSTELEPITPNHLLILKSGTAPRGVFSARDGIQRRWKQAQYMAEVFWERWVGEYVVDLQKRTKWLLKSTNLKKGDLVLLMGEVRPRLKWPLALVIETYPGEDGLVRTVKVKTATGEYVRPITKIALLEADCEQAMNS